MGAFFERTGRENACESMLYEAAGGRKTTTRVAACHTAPPYASQHSTAQHSTAQHIVSRSSLSLLLSPVFPAESDERLPRLTREPREVTAVEANPQWLVPHLVQRLGDDQKVGDAGVEGIVPVEEEEEGEEGEEGV